jgi:long-chain acyl-CoA synthetase
VLPPPGADWACLDEAGQVLPPNQVGEWGVRGPQVMLGHWRQPERTAQAFTAEGFFRTGQVAVMQTDGLFALNPRQLDA